MIWEIAGELGVDPYPLTLRKLVWMVDARRLAEWDRAALIACHVFNKDQRKQLPPRRFNPYRMAAAKRQKVTARQMGEFFQEAML